MSSRAPVSTPSRGTARPASLTPPGSARQERSCQGAVEGSLIHPPFLKRLREAEPPTPETATGRTELLVRTWAPLLGLESDRLQVKLDGPARRRLRARQLRGLALEQQIWLDPFFFQRPTVTGRFLLAHELAHLAQMRQRYGPFSSPPQAESEADQLAQVLVRGGAVPRVRRRLSPSQEAGKGEEKSLDLESIVKQSRKREIDEIKESLHTGFFDWAVTDEEVADILRVLQGMEFATAVAVIWAIGPDYRCKLIDNISPGHFKRYRTQILAVYVATEGPILAKYRSSLFKGMSFGSLSPEEHFAIRHTIEEIRKEVDPKGVKEEARWRPPQVRVEGNRDPIRELFETSPEPRFVLSTALQVAAGQEVEVLRAREEGARLRTDSNSEVARVLAFARSKLTYSWRDWAVTDEDVLQVLDKLADFVNETVKMRAVADALEAEGLMDRLVDNVPVEKLYAEISRRIGSAETINRRKVFLRLVSFRSPHRNVRAAERLLTSRLFSFHWSVEDEDAFLAFQLIKAVPPQARAGFFMAHPDGFIFGSAGTTFGTRMMETMSRNQRAGKEMNFYGGGPGGRDLTSIQTQLMEDEVWTLEGMERLAGLIRMAIAAGEHEWVFEQSRWRYLHQGSWRLLHENAQYIREIVEKFSLFRPPHRRGDGSMDPGRSHFQEQVAETLEDRGNIVQKIGTTLLYVGHLFKFLWNTHQYRNCFFSRTLKVKGFDLGEIQDLIDGDIAGVRFTELEDSAFGDEVRRENFLKWDLRSGLVQLQAKLVELAAINYPLENLKIQSGKGRVHDLYVHMGYPGKGQSATFIKLDIGQLDLEDLMLIWPDSMQTINRIRIKGLRLEMATPGLRMDRLPMPGSGLDWRTLLGRAPFLPIFGGWPPLLGWLGRLLSISKPLGQLKGGLLEPDKPLDVTLTFQDVRLEGVSTSGGQFIASLDLGPGAIRSHTPTRAGERYRDWLLQEKRRLDIDIAAEEAHAPSDYRKFIPHRLPSLRVERHSVEQELAYITQAEKEKEALQQRQATAPLGESDRHKLERLSHYLADLDKGGLSLNVSSTRIKGLAGRIRVGDLTVGEIQGYGRPAGASLGFLTQADTLHRMLRGPGYRPVLSGVEKEDPAFVLSVQELELGKVDVMGTIPTVEEARQTLREAEEELASNSQDLLQQTTVERATQRLEATQMYWKTFRQTNRDLTAGEQEAFQKAKTFLENDKAFHANKTVLTDLTLELAHGGSASKPSTLGAFSVGQLDAYGIKARAVHLSEVHGTNLRVAATAAGGLRDLLEFRQALQSSGVAADRLEAVGITHQEKGLLVQHAVATRLGAQANFKGGSVDVKAARVSVTGLGMSARVGLLQQRLAFLKTKSSRTAGETAQVEELEKRIPVLETLLAQRRQAYQQLSQARTAQDKAAAQEAIDLLDYSELSNLGDLGAVGITLKDLEVHVSELGDMMADGYDLQKELRNGVTLTGRAEDQQLVSSLQVKEAFGRTSHPADASKAELEAGEINVGATSGTIRYSESQIKVTQFRVASLSLSRLLLTTSGAGGAGHQLWSGGTSSLENLLIDAELNFTPRTVADAEGKERVGDYRLSEVLLNRFSIGSITAGSLGYFNALHKFEAQLESGSIVGVHAEDCRLSLPENASPTFQGKAGIKGINALQVRGLMEGAVANAEGKLNGHDLEVEAFQNGDWSGSLGDLALAAGFFRGRDGWARFSFKNLRGKISKAGDTYTLDGVQLGEFRLGAFHIAAQGKTIESKGATVLSGARLTASVTMREKQVKEPEIGPPRAPEMEPAKITITRFHLDSLLSDHLLYQDGDLKVEIKKPTPGEPTEMKGFQPLFIGNVNVIDLEWSPEAGITKGSAKVGAFETTAFVDEFKKGLHGGLALKAKNLGANFYGKDLTKIDLGEIERTGGFFKGKGVDTRFTTGRMVGGVNLGRDYVELINYSIDDIQLAKSTFDNGAGLKLGLESARIGALELGKVRANLHTVSKGGKEVQEIKEVLVDNFRLKRVTASGLIYDGESHGQNKKGEAISSKQHVEAREAWLQELFVSQLSHNLLTDETLVKFNLEVLDPSKAPFGANGVVARLTKTIGDKNTLLHLISDVRGGKAQGELRFKTVKLAPDRPWTSIDGTFTLNQFGLLKPEFTYIDEKGMELSAKAYMDEAGKQGRIDLVGLKAQFLPNGTALVGFEALRARNIKIARGTDLKVDLPFAELEGFASALKGYGTEEGLELLAAKAQSLSVEEMRVDLDIDRGKTSKPPGKGGPPPSRFQVQPLRKSKGEVDLEYHMLGNNPEPQLPIEEGVILLGKAGWPYYVLPMGVNEDGLYVEIPVPTSDPEGMGMEPPPDPPRINIVPTMKGFHAGTGLLNRGSIDLLEVVEGLINPEPSAEGESKPAKGIPKLNDLEIWSKELQLGNGQIGTATNHVVLEGLSSGDNKLVIPRNRVGERLELQLPAVRMSKAAFEGENLQGKTLPGKTGPIQLLGVNVTISGLANLRFTITLVVEKGKINRVEMGDVSFLNAEKLQGLARPKPEEVKQVKPEAKP